MGELSSDLFAALGQIAAGWYLADLGGGLFHWFIDHVCPAWLWPFRGTVRDFREHHDDRLSMERYSRVPSIVASAIGALPAVLLAAAVGLYWLAGAVFAGGCLIQHAHYYAHTPRPPRWAKALQQLGVFLSPAAHERHHNDFYRSYGVLNGWSHGLLDLCLGRRYA